MKSRTIALVLALMLMVAGAVDAKPYINSVSLSAATTASTVNYFAAVSSGLTATFSASQSVDYWSVSNAGASAVNLRIYTKAAPNYAKPFGDAFSSDYVTLRVQPKQSISIDGITLIGWHMETAPTGVLTIVGWNR